MKTKPTNCKKFFMVYCITLILTVFAHPITAHEILFPNNQLTIGVEPYSMRNIDIPQPPHPIFFDSSFKTDSGVIASYEKVLFHTKKYFSIHFGTSLAEWQLDSQTLITLSAFFELRWWIFRSSCFNPYLAWSLAGPTLLSNRHFAGSQLGKNFIFQDWVGAGIMFGKYHHLNVEVKMYHYSNGDLFVHNNGLNVPVVIALGYSF